MDSSARTVVVQGGAFGEHQIESAAIGGTRQVVGAGNFSVKLAPGSGAKLTLTMRRYANVPTLMLPWERR